MSDHLPHARVPRLDDLSQAERDVLDRIGHLPIDFDAMAVVSNVYRAASVIGRHMKQTVLDDAQLSWTAFVTLWVLWIWGEMEARHLASEVNVTKGTLSTNLDGLERRGLLRRRRHTDDRRLLSVSLTAEGEGLISEVFPKFNLEEQRIAGTMSAAQRRAVAAGLRRVVRDFSPYGD